MAEPVRTIEEFLEVARKSELVDAGRLESAVADWPNRSQPLPEELVRRLVEAELLTQWQADQLRKGRHKGFTLGRYKLRGLIGAGGMSSVYLAEHTTLHNLVAIKVLPLKRVDKTSYLARFEREAQAAARLSHPHIVKAFDLDTSGSIHYIAMEYVDGVDLHAKVKRDGPLPLREAIDYVRQTALGLQYAHDEGFVHRDIKPANLILDKKGVVKILDLGLAFAGGEDEDSLTREHNEKVLGTADYLAPEQARDSHAADRRSDIYALGCTLYYLLVGRPPFAKGTLAERIQAHLHQSPPNLLVDAAGVPPAIADLYFRMLEKHPDARPQTAKEIAELLDAWLKSADQPTSGSAILPRRGLPRRTGTGDSGVRAAPSAGSGIDAVQPAGDRSPPRLPPPVMRPPAGRGRPGSGIRTVTGDQQAAAARRPDHEEKPKATPRGRPRDVLGLPLTLWLAGLAGLVLAGFLAYLVLSRGPGTKARKPREPAAADQAADGRAPSESDAEPPEQPAQPDAAPDAEARGPRKSPRGKPAPPKPSPAPTTPGPLDEAIMPPADAPAEPTPGEAATSPQP